MSESYHIRLTVSIVSPVTSDFQFQYEVVREPDILFYFARHLAMTGASPDEPVAITSAPALCVARRALPTRFDLRPTA